MFRAVAILFLLDNPILEVAKFMCGPLGNSMPLTKNRDAGRGAAGDRVGMMSSHLDV